MEPEQGEWQLVDSKDLPEIEEKAVREGIGFVSAGPGKIKDVDGREATVPEGKAAVRLDI